MIPNWYQCTFHVSHKLRRIDVYLYLFYFPSQNWCNRQSRYHRHSNIFYSFLFLFCFINESLIMRQSGKEWCGRWPFRHRFFSGHLFIFVLWTSAFKKVQINLKWRPIWKNGEWEIKTIHIFREEIIKGSE